MPREGELKVWWIPQIPMNPFEVPVENMQDAVLILVTLARYDIFQFDNNIKPDFSNAGGLNIFECGEWVDWYDEDDNDIDFYVKKYIRKEPI
jgi:hypothetical protein